jgi:hypothetical protein
MIPDLLLEFAGIQTEVETADIADESRKTALWCLRQLPRLYQELASTHESKYAAEVVRLARGALQAIAGDGSPAALAAAETVTARLRALHVRVGFPGLELKPLTPPKRARRKAG